LRFNQSIADSVISPRIHQQWRPVELFIENHGFGKEVREELADRGWALKDTAASARMHAIERFPATGRVWGIADPRSEGGVAFE
jgi:gamma-glutamyltranspeptidase